MSNPTTVPKTVLETILDWSNGRPLWQRDALRRIIAKGKMDAGDIKELTEICKQTVNGKVTGIPLDKTHLPANPGAGASISLASITDVAGANNLAAGQKLEFETNGITVIYGDNGAGKSGYVRILKRACRARESGEIYPNIYAEGAPPPAASATIAYNVGGKAQKPESWQDADHPHPVLSAASVFDSDCADVHIGEKNEVAFRPFGLDVPDELAGACQAVKEALTAEQKLQEKAKNPIFLRPTWKDFTRAGKILSSLKANSDFKAITALGTLTEQERARLTRLKEDLSKDPAKAAAEQKLKADNVSRLRTAVHAMETQTSDTALAKVFALGKDAFTKREAARIAAEKAFSGESLKGIGGEAWRALWESARRYSVQAVPGQPFPPAEKDVLCVLCQQPLEDDAIARMAAFDDFVKKDAEQQAQQAEKASQDALRTLLALKIGIHPVKASLQEAALHKPEIAKQALRAIAFARLRRYATSRAIAEAEKLALPAAAPSPITALQQLETEIRNYSAELQKSAADEERKKLELELAELSDRTILGDMLKIAEDEITRLQNIEFLVKCIADTTTNAITKIGNDIADTIITPKLRDRFQEEIVKLAAEKVRVEIVRSGGKYGSPQYQVRLFAKPEAEVSAILSEGEQTCVALAAFLTELATATHRSALVFDDPVCSLDHRWRKQVAKRLVEESEKRQVIVFTHDLVFVNDLLDLAEANGRPVKPVSIHRGATGTGIVAEGMPWIAQRVEDRIDKLEKAMRAAKQLHDKNQDQEYRKEAASIYNHLRASWERALEDIAFFRVVQRHRDYIDTKNLKKVSVLTDTDCDVFHAGFKKCCDVVDAHDPSSGRNPEAPPPAEIEKDIQALKTWVAALRDRQKKVA